MTPTHMARRLMECGLSQRQIADAIGTKQQNISSICSGKSCAYETGKKLEQLYTKIVLEKKTLAEAI